MVGSLLLYAGLIMALAGGVYTLRSPRRGAALLAIGLGAVFTGFILPARERRVANPATRLDEFAPAWQFNEFHEVHVQAAPDRVFEAIKAVTANEILFFRTLTWIRRMGRPSPESILNAPLEMPLIEVATRNGFLRLADEPPRELVLGTIVVAPAEYRGYRGPMTPEIYRTLRKPGFALATMNFLVRPVAGGGSVVSTETRVFATSAASRGQFTPYWRVIYPGSALIRRMWLRAIKKRAEMAAS